jgi:TolB-like protein
LTDIFISYARSTATLARTVADALSAHGYDVWLDQQLPAHRAYGDVIEEQLNAARAVVVIWSQDAARSEWVRSEANRAREQRKLVQTSVDRAPLPMPFEQIQCADLVDWTGDERTPGWQSVLAGIRALLGTGSGEAARAALHAVAPGPAPGDAPERIARAGPVVAVLPFDNQSNDPEMLFFSDGVSEEIIQRLSRGARLKVIGRTSSFQFRGERKGEAARALGASHVLDGSIRRDATRLRVSAHLVESASNTTLWSERYDRGLEDLFAVQDDISERIACALDRTFASFSTRAVDPAIFDLYLRSSPRSYSPDELRQSVALLETATARAPAFAEAWGRLGYLRAWLRMYQPYPGRAATARRVEREAARALELDPQNIDALAALWLVVAPFGRFIDADAALERVRWAPGTGDGQMYVGWDLRATGRLREGAVETERCYELDPLNPMAANLVALSRMATGRVADAVPVLQDLAARVPDMSFPVANLLRAYAFLGDWDAADRLLDPAAGRPLREFQDGLAFYQAKRDPSPARIGAIRDALHQRTARAGHVDVSRLVYAAHLGLVDDAYAAADRAGLGPAGSDDDLMGPDAYRTGLMFHPWMPELRSDRRFVQLCARLGLVRFWTETGKWPDCADELPYDFRGECERMRGIEPEAFGY